MSFFRRVTVLGMQPLPKFVNTATLCMSEQCFIDEIPFPESEGIYNIACLAFFPRSVVLDDLPAFVHQPVGISFWAKDKVSGIANIYGQDKVVVPQGAEHFAVSWLAPPVSLLAFPTTKPQPEDWFRVVFGLKI